MDVTNLGLDLYTYKPTQIFFPPSKLILEIIL